MSEFSTRYAKLNPRQREAVDHIDGPLLVVAGPGTGKTELLSMRVAQILKKTDTLASNILCLTFTDSGATAMRERLAGIVGADAYKVAIHTFHSFGSEIIGRHNEFFYRGADFKPADELAQYEILRGIFDELEYTSPLAGKNADTYTHLSDAMTVISELKRSGLTSDELRKILAADEAVCEALAPDIAAIFANRISKSTLHLLAPLAEKAATVAQSTLPPGITPYANVMALSIAHAVDEAVEADSTKPITAWKAKWCEKDDAGNVVLKDIKRIEKLRAVSHIYYQYLTRMEAAGLYDYDDMIMNVVHTIETHADLRANVAEQYQYILVDEFQDTNLAQLRLLFDLTAGTEQPNVMAVGDDDQAIYSFQGADVGNIHRFRTQYGDPPIVVLTDNYRSTADVLNASRSVITQGTDRLEDTIDDLSKVLTPHAAKSKYQVSLHEYANPDAERAGVVAQISSLITSGVPADSIAVLARRHHELEAMLPYFADSRVGVNYERRDNILEHDIVRLLEHLAGIIDAIHREALDEADALIPEIISHPAFGYGPLDIWKISLASYRSRSLWMETMLNHPEPTFRPFAEWLIVRAAAVHVESFETQIDALLGIEIPSDAQQQPSSSLSPQPSIAEGSTLPVEPTQDKAVSEVGVPEEIDGRGDSASDDTKSSGSGAKTTVFTSPLYNYFFNPTRLTAQPDTYLDTLEALRTLRDRLREHYANEQPSLAGLLDYLATARQLGSRITSVRHRGDHVAGLVNLMSAHKSKGLEYDHVYIIGAVDGMWGQRVRSRNRLISYPANLPLAPSGDSYDERLRLFYVAMTRARQALSISYSTADLAAKPQLAASFLADTALEATVHDTPADITTLTRQAELDWRGVVTADISPDMRQLLASTLERYKLSSTHLSNFLDVSRGGPQYFLTTNLLRFPQAKSAAAAYGTAIHTVLQRAHAHLRTHGQARPLEDLLGDYERILGDQYLSEADYEFYLGKGIDSLGAFLTSHYASFTTTQQTEVGFSHQSVVLGDARLTGSLDLVDIDSDAMTIRVTDYKTGKPSRDWRGKTDYEKIKLHKYRQQLMFYELLTRNSRDYSKYQFAGGVLQFVEPTRSGDIVALEASFTEEELAEFSTLIQRVWQRIITLDLPDISDYEPAYSGVMAFERDILDSSD